jgi:hypothetical protein
LLGWSYAYVYLKGRLDILGREALGGKSWADYYLGLYAFDQPGWLRVVKSIEKLAAYCRKNGIPLVIANYPELHYFKNYRFAGVGNKIKTIAQRVGANFIDLLGAVAGQTEPTLWVSPSDPHPNGHANKFFAEAFLPAVRKAEAGR